LIAIDTNLLVYAHRASAPQHVPAKTAIERAAGQAAGWGIPLPCVFEFLSVVTHPSTPRPSTPEEAGAFIDALISSGGASLWSPGRGFWSRFAHLARELDVVGPRIFDLQIAVIAVENGAYELWSHDRRFVRIPGLEVVDPI
jgi:toxin-antitoxin system PIN domain toxin